MDTSSDPLWDPQAPADADLRRIETLLRSQRHPQHRVPAPAWSMTSARRGGRRPMRVLLAACAVLGLALAMWLPWRLQWDEGQPWPVLRAGRIEMLAVGDSLGTGPSEHLRLSVARIGEVTLAPNSRVSLIATGTQRHRLALQHGRLHARIWAPPGRFGVLHGGAETIDLGCEFDLLQRADGSGALRVRSGWVLQQVAGAEVLVPAGHAIAFDRKRSTIPLREAASPALRSALEELDTRMTAGWRIEALEAAVAASATGDDAFALLSLLTRHPALASGPVYPRLASLLRVDAGNGAHRKAWAAGSHHAMEAWWERIPQPPKQWWWHWRDALR